MEDFIKEAKPKGLLSNIEYHFVEFLKYVDFFFIKKKKKSLLKMEDFIREAKPEALFSNMEYHFVEIVKYVDFFISKDFSYRKYHLEELNRIYGSLIRNARYILTDLYKEKIENIFPEEAENLANTNEKVKSIMKTLLPEGKESENL